MAWKVSAPSMGWSIPELLRHLDRPSTSARNRNGHDQKQSTHDSYTARRSATVITQQTADLWSIATGAGHARSSPVRSISAGRVIATSTRKKANGHEHVLLCWVAGKRKRGAEGPCRTADVYSVAALDSMPLDAVVRLQCCQPAAISRVLRLGRLR